MRYARAFGAGIHVLFSCAAAHAASPPTGFLFWWIHWHFRNEAVPVRHFDLRQTLVVHHVGLRDDAVPKEQKCRQRVDLVRSQRSRLRDRHRTVDIVPRDRRIWVVGDTVPVLRFERAAERLAGLTQHQTSENSAFPILAVTDLAPLRKDHRAFFGGTVSRRKCLSLWA